MNKSIISAACLAVLGLGMFVGSFATAGQTDLVGDRAATMKRIRNSYRVLVEMAQSGAFDAATVMENSDEILTDMAIFKGLFPQGPQQGDAIARPEIWTDRRGFDKAWDAGENAVANLRKVSAADAYVPALESLAAACRGCHRNYVAQH